MASLSVIDLLKHSYINLIQNNRMIVSFCYIIDNKLFHRTTEPATANPQSSEKKLYPFVLPEPVFLRAV